MSADIISFKQRAKQAKAKSQRSTLCQEGHHQWVVDKAKEFDVKRGALITLYRCSRCGKTKVQAH